MWRASRLLTEARIRHGFSDAQSGDFRLGPLPDGIAVARQVHGAAVLAAPAVGRNHQPADALWTAGDGLASDQPPAIGVGIFTADCAPLLIADPGSRRVAAAHAGWRGARAGVAAAAVQALCAAGSRAAELRVAIGPAIGGCCYQVGVELLREFRRIWGESVDAGDGRLNLVRAVELQLLAAGVRAAAIDLEPAECTVCTRERTQPGAVATTFRYFSHRRQANAAGRMLSWIAVG